MNTQPIEKFHHSDGSILQVHSVFFTIQGEGPFAGRPALFIRLAGCNLMCPLCDTEYTGNRVLRDPLQLVKHGAPMLNFPGRPLVVITGGEPFRQNIEPLVKELIFAGFVVQVETNGTLPIPDGLAILSPKDFVVVVSPKTSKVQISVAYRANAWKYVVNAGNIGRNGLPTIALGNNNEGKLAAPPQGYDGPIYLQPCDDKDEAKNAANLKTAAEACMAHGYTLQLQLHKLIGME